MLLARGGIAILFKASGALAIFRDASLTSRHMLLPTPSPVTKSASPWMKETELVAGEMDFVASTVASRSHHLDALEILNSTSNGSLLDSLYNPGL